MQEIEEYIETSVTDTAKCAMLINRAIKDLMAAEQLVADPDDELTLVCIREELQALSRKI